MWVFAGYPFTLFFAFDTLFCCFNTGQNHQTKKDEILITDGASRSGSSNDGSYGNLTLQWSLEIVRNQRYGHLAPESD